MNGSQKGEDDCLKQNEIDMATGMKTGGRQKGVPNKVTAETKAWVQQLIDGNKKQFEKDLNELEPKDRLMILERLMQYVIPKQQAISVEAQIQTEYAELQKLLESAPDEVVDLLTERIKSIMDQQNEAEQKR
jgi:hypothetical protein